MGIFRKSGSVRVLIASGESDSSIFNMAQYSGALIKMPGAWTAANIGFKVCDTADGTFLPLMKNNADGEMVAVQAISPVIDTECLAPVEIFAAKFMKLWSQDGDGVDVNQGADRELVVTMKS